jgi:NitT/TauT family transport system substrate-binding protein
MHIRGKFIAAIAVTAVLLTGCSTGGGDNTDVEVSDLLPAPEISNIRVGVGATEISQYATYFAADQKLFQKYGFDNVEASTFEGDGKAMAAMQAGQLDAAAINPSTAVLSQNSDAPVVMIAVTAAIATDSLVTRGDIKTADDLKGKRIAISSLGGGSHASALLALDALGLDPDQVAFTHTGGQDARVAALLAGSVDAAIVDSALNDKMTAQGLNILVDLKKERLPSGRAGIAVTKEWLDKNPNAARALVATILEAQNTFWVNPDLVSERYADFAQIDLDDATALVTDFQDIGDRSLTWTPEVFTRAKDILMIADPSIANVDVTAAYDESIINDLAAAGVYKAIGVADPEWQ